MRRRNLIATAALAASALILSGCGTESPTGGETSASPSASSSTSSAAPVDGEPGGCAAPAHTFEPAANITELENADSLPVSTGSFGEKPEFTFPEGVEPGSELEVIVLAKGAGEAVNEGDYLVANYLGNIWGGEVFDNSYDRSVPAGFPIGTGTVIPGWDQGLVGQTIGSRVMLVIPPALGYGEAGNSQAGILGTDTLVFVVDIVESCVSNALALDAPTEAEPLPADGPQVTGTFPAAPVLTIGDAAEPTETQTTVIATGAGEPVVAGSVVLQYVAVTWAGESAGTSWGGEIPPMTVPVLPGDPNAMVLFDGLLGLPVGSRVLIQDAAVGMDSPAMAVVLDIVAQVSYAQ